MSGKPNWIDAVGGAASFAGGCVSALVTIVLAANLQLIVDMNDPVPIISVALASILVGWTNGWRMRGHYNDVSAEAEERIALMRDERAAERARKAADAQAERDRLERDAQAERDRLAREQDERLRRERERLQAEAVARRFLLGFDEMELGALGMLYAAPGPVEQASDDTTLNRLLMKAWSGDGGEARPLVERYGADIYPEPPTCGWSLAGGFRAVLAQNEPAFAEVYRERTGRAWTDDAARWRERIGQDASSVRSGEGR